MRGYRYFAALFSVAGVMLVTAPRASATAELTLTTSDGHSVVVVASSCGTGCEVASFNGTVGGWNLNITSGTGDVSGSPNLMDLAFLDQFKGGAGSTLTIKWSDTDFSTPASGFQTNIGGTVTTKGTAAASLYGGVSDTLNDTTSQIGTTMNFTPVAFSGTENAFLSTISPSPYSLTEVLTISFAGGSAGQSSGDYSVDAVPEPTSVVLLGTVMLGFLALARRKVGAANKA